LELSVVARQLSARGVPPFEPELLDWPVTRRADLLTIQASFANYLSYADLEGRR